MVDKIRRAKARGDLNDVLGGEICDHCGQILAPELLPASPTLSPEAEIAALRRRIHVLEALLTPGVPEPPTRLISALAVARK